MVQVNIVKRVVIDCAGLLIILGATLAINFTSISSRGYHKDDKSITLPYRPDTVPEWALAVVNLPVIFIFIIIFEIFNAKNYGKGQKYYGFSCFVVYLYRYTFALCYGFIITVFLTIVGKHSMGRMRPHFLDLCKPINLVENNFGYITDFTCSSNAAEKLLIDSQKSFPSGHSSTAIFTSLFLADYVRRRLPSKRQYVSLGAMLQTLSCAAGFYICLSRITDNKHHWSDVLFGGILGGVIAIVNPYFINYVHYQSLSKETIKPTLEECGELLPHIRPMLKSDFSLERNPPSDC